MTALQKRLKKTIILPGFRPGSDENVERERRE